MIGANPLESRDDPTTYVPLTSARASGGSDPIKKISPAHPAISVLRHRPACLNAPTLAIMIYRNAWGSAPTTLRSNGAMNVVILGIRSAQSARTTASCTTASVLTRARTAVPGRHTCQPLTQPTLPTLPYLYLAVAVALEDNVRLGCASIHVNNLHSPYATVIPIN
jgi:hypothetical protein